MQIKWKALIFFAGLCFVFINLIFYSLETIDFLEKKVLSAKGYQICDSKIAKPTSSNGASIYPPDHKNGIVNLVDAKGSIFKSYSVQFDKAGHRIGFKTEDKAASNKILISDSFGFGVGVEGNETFWALLAKKDKSNRYLNWSLAGFGVNDFLDRRGQDFLDTSQFKGKVEVYLVTAGRMLMRSFCKFNCQSTTNQFIKNRPRYIWNGQALERIGIWKDFTSDGPFEFHKILGLFPVGRFWLTWDQWNTNQQESEILVQSVLALKSYFQTHAKLVDFKIIYLPGAIPDKINWMNEQWNKQGISTHFLTPSMKIKDLFVCSDILPEGHPSPSGHARIAEAIWPIVSR